MVLGRIVNLEQLEDSHYKVSSFLWAQKLSLLLRLCRVEYSEEAVQMFYGNLHCSGKGDDLETLILGGTYYYQQSTI